MGEFSRLTIGFTRCAIAGKAPLPAGTPQSAFPRRQQARKRSRVQPMLGRHLTLEQIKLGYNFIK